MEVYLNRIDGWDDAIISMFLSKRTLTRELENEIRNEEYLQSIFERRDSKPPLLSRILFSKKYPKVIGVCIMRIGAIRSNDKIMVNNPAFRATFVENEFSKELRYFSSKEDIAIFEKACEALSNAKKDTGYYELGEDDLWIEYSREMSDSGVSVAGNVYLAAEFTPARLQVKFLTTAGVGITSCFDTTVLLHSFNTLYCWYLL